MEINEGYNYRINIVSADSSILVDSYNGVIQGSVKGIDGFTLVDAYNNTIHGTFVGNIVDHNNNLVFDYVQKTLSIDKLNSHKVDAESITSNLYNNKNEMVFNCHESSISNINYINSKNILTEEIKSNFIQGSVFSKDNSLIIDAATKIIYGSLLGNLVDHNHDLIFDLEKNTIIIGQLNSKLVNTNKLVVENIYNSNNKIVYNGVENSLKNIETISANELIGDLIGDIYNSSGSIVFDNTNHTIYTQNIKSIKNNNLITFGTETDLIDLELNLNSVLTMNLKSKNIDDEKGISAFHFNFYPVNSQNNNIDVNVLGLITCSGLHNSVLKTIGTVGFVIDYVDMLNKNLDTIPSYFIVKPDNGMYDDLDESEILKPNSSFFNKCMTFGNQTLSAPIFKVGIHKNMNNISAEKGMIIFNDSTGKFQGYTGTAWVDLH